MHPTTMPSIHVPVLADEVIEGLQPTEGMIVFDGTLGGGGHTRLLAERVGATGRVIACDLDPHAIARAKDEMADLPVVPMHASYAFLPEILRELEIDAVDRILLDLGLSSDQLDSSEGGFGFSDDVPLDLRFDPTEGEPAWRMLQRMRAESLADLIYEFGEERFSRRIGRKIVEKTRRGDPPMTAAELAELVSRCVPRSRDSRRIHPATRTFQALRIAVNDELVALQRSLAQIPSCLRPGGRVAIISFHSLEDRLVKHAFRDDPYTTLTKKPIRPNEVEIDRNPRCRSAKLRIAEVAMC